MSHQFRFSSFRDIRDVRPRLISVEWDQHVAALMHFSQQRKKGGPLWSPAVYREGATRCDEGVQHLTALVLDYDCEIPRRARDRWDELGLEYVIHSTHSHSYDDPHLRVVVPFLRPVDGADWGRVRPALIRHLYAEQADQSCRDAARFYYWPTCRPGADTDTCAHPGAFLDPYRVPDTLPDDDPPAPSSGGAAPADRRSATVAVAPAQTPASAPVAAPFITAVRPALRDTLLHRALDQGPGARHQSCLWLASQAWDNGMSDSEVDQLVLCYAAQVPQPAGKEEFGEPEALAIARWVQTLPRREAWATPGLPVTLAAPDSDVLSAALAGIRQDRSLIWQPEALAALVTLRQSDPVRYAAARETLKAAGISMKNLDLALRGIVAPVQAPAESSGDTLDPTAGDMLSDARDPAMLVPRPWRLRPDETGHMAETQDGARWQRIAYGPVQITGRAHTDDGQVQRLVVAWRRGHGRWVSRMVPRETVLRSRTVGDLAALGFPYDDSRARELVAYLGAVEAANLDRLPTTRISTTLGWQGVPSEEADTPFLLGEQVLIGGHSRSGQEIDVDHPELWEPGQVLLQAPDSGTRMIAAAFHSAGTWPGWLKLLRAAAPHPAVMLSIYASLASPLLRILGVPNFGVEWAYPTSTGKTTTLRVAMSVWGQPDESKPESVVQTWDMTQVYAERVASLLGDLPLALDDTKKVADKPRTISAVVYLMAAGRQRGRGNVTGGVDQSVTWSGVLLSTGEEPLTTMVTDGGAKTRMMTVPGCPLIERSRSAADIALQLNSLACEHYGLMGPRWVSFLQSRSAEWGAWREMYAALRDDYASNGVSPESSRLAQYAAVITLTRELARVCVPEWAHLPELGDPMIILWRDVATQSADASGAGQALHLMLSWIAAERSRIEETGTEDILSRIGVQTSVGLGIYTTHVREQLKKWGYSDAAILREWAERGWIAAQGGVLTRVVKLPLSDGVVRCVVFTRQAFDEYGKEY